MQVQQNIKIPRNSRVTTIPYIQVSYVTEDTDRQQWTPLLNKTLFSFSLSLSLSLSVSHSLVELVTKVPLDPGCYTTLHECTEKITISI